MSVSMAAPVSDVDLFGDGHDRDPYPDYATLRAAGGAVWMQRHELWAISRYADVRAALADWQTFSSAQGVGLNSVINELTEGGVITADPPAHERLHEILSSQLAAREIRSLRAQIERQAADLVDDVAEAAEVDGVEDIAKRFPLSVVFDLIGFPDEGRDHVLGWAKAAFNAFGPMNARTQQSLPDVGQMYAFLIEATADRVKPGSFAATIHQAVAAGTVDAAEGLNLLAAYTTAGLDTTINSISAALHLFACHPDQWDLVRANPHQLVPSAYNEVLRYASPVKSFARRLTHDHTIDGVVLPAGSWATLLYASANRDERHYTHPDRFDVHRRATDHLAFGLGLHHCAGQSLARLESHAILGALARKIARIEAVGEPEWTPNNLLRGLHRLPLRLRRV